MPDRQLMRTQPITDQDRQQLQAYGFSDNEIDLLRRWVMESTWEKGERSDALKELSAIAATLEKMQNKLIRLGHRNTAMVRDILHIHQQLDANGTPRGFSQPISAIWILRALRKNSCLQHRMSCKHSALIYKNYRVQ